MAAVAPTGAVSMAVATMVADTTVVAIMAAVITAGDGMVAATVTAGMADTGITDTDTDMAMTGAAGIGTIIAAGAAAGDRRARPDRGQR